MEGSGLKTTKFGISSKAMTSVPCILKAAKCTSCRATDVHTTVYEHDNVAVTTILSVSYT
jgi:hypothetical protein